MSTWDGLDEFVAVAHAGTFAAGARALNVSSSHMSRAIAQLESRLATTLFHRTTRSVRLTDTGRIFLEHCEGLVRERNEAIAQISAEGEPQGELRITCSTAMGERYIAPIVRRFVEDFPKLNVSLDLSNRVVDLIQEDFDLGIRTGKITDTRLIARQVASRAFFTCASPAYVERHGKPEAIAALAQHQCLRSTATHWLFRVDGKEMQFRPKGRWHCNSGAVTLEAALTGTGICQLPEFYVLPHLSTGLLVEVLAENRPAPEPIWAVYPQRRHLMPKVSQLVDRLQYLLPAALVSIVAES